MRRRPMLWVGSLAGALLVAGWSERVDYESCHVCRRTRRVSMRSFLGWTYRTDEHVSRPERTADAHPHAWSRRARSRRQGWGGCLGWSAAASAHRFRDGTD